MKLFTSIIISISNKRGSKPLIILILLLLPAFHSTLSQSFIGPGNRWDYIEGWWWNGSGESDTISYYASEDTVFSNGKTYNKVLPQNHFFMNYIRTDSVGVWYFIPECNDEFLYYSYEDTIGQIRNVPSLGCDTLPITKTWDTLEVVFGDTLRVVGYHHVYNMEDAAYISISPGLGFIRWNLNSWNANYFEVLKGCVISGTVHGTLLVEAENQPERVLSYTLEQNYPNPFNPTTTINYSIPGYSKIVIKVFDILGNEIAALINEEKPAGTYEVTWNAGDLPSSVYFCQLRSAGYVETKKMILMR